MTQWISVDERLPEKQGKTLVSDGREIEIQEWYGSGWVPVIDVTYECDHSIYSPTHWMPLPEGPK